VSLVYDEIIAAVPAPIGTNGPVPGRIFKVEAARQPEAVMIGIEAFNAVTIGRAKVFETAVLESMFNVISLIVRPVVPVPMVFIHVWRGIHMTCHMALGLGPGVGIVAPFRRLRNVALIGAWPILPAFLPMLLPALREDRKSRD